MIKRRYFRILFPFLFLSALFFAGCGPNGQAPETREEPIGQSTAPSSRLTADEARAIAKEAWIYGFPLVMNYKTMYLYVVDENSTEYKGPFNHLACEARLFTPDDKAIVTPNADTPYCMFWLDLRAGPLVLSVPRLKQNRFFQFQFIDLYTHNFAYVSTLTTRNNGGHYLITGSEWNGEVPEGISKVIPSETDFVFTVTRTQLFGPEDLEQVKKIQQSYSLLALSAFQGEEAPDSPPEIDFPEWKEGAQFDAGFFGYFDFMLSLVTPAQEERGLFERFAKIGLGTDEVFDINALPTEISAALHAGVEDGLEELEAFIAIAGGDPLASTKIFGTREFLEASAQKYFDGYDKYHFRSAAAHLGLYGNSAVEAIYPTYLVDAAGLPLSAAANGYQMTFAQGQLPPVNAFWSLTMYDAMTQLFIENPLNRYLLNSAMMEQFQREPDGSIVIFIQHDTPGSDKVSNWLPAPAGPFYMVLRLYGPQEAALEGEWLPPPAVKIQ